MDIALEQQSVSIESGELAARFKELSDKGNVKEATRGSLGSYWSGRRFNFRAIPRCGPATLHLKTKRGGYGMPPANPQAASTYRNRLL